MAKESLEFAIIEPHLDPAVLSNLHSGKQADRLIVLFEPWWRYFTTIQVVPWLINVLDEPDLCEFFLDPVGFQFIHLSMPLSKKASQVDQRGSNQVDHDRHDQDNKSEKRENDTEEPTHQCSELREDAHHSVEAEQVIDRHGPNIHLKTAGVKKKGC